MALRYIPCARNENKGEQITRNYLMSYLAHMNGILLGNYHLPFNNSTKECDFVLFNQYGAWIIEVKNWRGLIKIDQVNWKRNDGYIEHSPLIRVENKVRTLSTMLENAKFKNISVVGFVVLAHESAELQNSADGKSREPREDMIFRLDARLIRALQRGQHRHKADNRELNRGEIEQIVDMLLPLTIDPQQERISDSYRIVYDLGPGPDRIFHAYQAENIDMPGWYARAKKYYTPAAFSTKDLVEAINRFKRDMEALARMTNHPHIVQVHHYQADRDSDDTYWLFVEWITGDTLQDRLDNGLHISFQDQIRILNAMLSALEYCHSKGILHRNLTPACIYLARDGAIKLGDFDFARISDDALGTITITGQPLLLKGNRYMAPELQKDASSADERSDLYALGAIWYDMLVYPDPDEDINLVRLKEVDLPDDACDLLTRLLSADPNERPKNAGAVKRWLELSLS